MSIEPLPPFVETSGKFREDDLEFRTVTTMLYILGSHDELGPDTTSVTPRMERHLKLLASVSAMLVMNHDVIAIMPKRSAAGLTLFIGPEPNPDMGGVDVVEDEGDGDAFSSLHLVTKNPRNNEGKTGPVALMKIPDVNVGDDIFEFIVSNWNQPFEAHAQAIARLISACYSGIDPWLRLAHYSLFQSAPRASRRFTTDVFFKLLTTLPTTNVDDTIPTSFPRLSDIDKEHVRGLFTDDDDLADRFPLLGEFVDSDNLCIPTDARPFLREFHDFFVFLLCDAKRKVDTLQDLRKAQTPASVDAITIEVERAHSVVADLHHFVWNSEFFKWYISLYQRQAISIRYGELTRRDYPVPNLARDCREYETMADIQPSATVDDGDDENDQDDEAEMGDFPTEFQTIDDLLQSLHPLDGPAHKTYSWLRLITSTFHHALRFKRTSPGVAMKLDFQVIKYPMSDKMMKPWEEILAELAGDAEIEKEMLEALRSKADGDTKFTPFLATGPKLKFNGRAHCEAVLGCLHSLAKRSQNISWAGVPQELMDILKTTFSIVAPSKRCCPICANLIASLSREDGAPVLHTLTKHPYIFPTAFPCGLPERIRRQLLGEYKARLRTALHALIAAARTSSGLSLQSQPLSAGSADEADQQSKLEEAKRDNTIRWVKGWLREAEPRRRQRWLKLWKRSPDQWEKYRVEMVAQGPVWNGLAVPLYVFAEHGGSVE